MVILHKGHGESWDRHGVRSDWEDDGVEALLAGLVIGLGSGVAPGPLLALAIATTLRRGLAAGLAVACGPLVSDALIIALTVTVVSQLSDTAVTVLSLIGGLVIAAFGIETLRAARTADVDSMREEVAEPERGRMRSLASHPLAQATVLNLLNPAPWLFWATAGAALLLSFWDRSPALGVAYLVFFYAGLVGSKAIVVLGIAAGRHRLSTPVYRLILAGAGVLMLVLAAVFLVRAATTLW
ncbi:MAG: LysE family transporter [Actinomycetes bacterium]